MSVDVESGLEEAVLVSSHDFLVDRAESAQTLLRAPVAIGTTEHSHGTDKRLGGGLLDGLEVELCAHAEEEGEADGHVSLVSNSVANLGEFGVAQVLGSMEKCLEIHS